MVHNHGRAEFGLVSAGVMEPVSLRHLLLEHSCVLAGEGEAGKVSEVLNAIGRFVRATGILVDTFSKWKRLSHPFSRGFIRVVTRLLPTIIVGTIIVGAAPPYPPINETHR